MPRPKDAPILPKIRNYVPFSGENAGENGYEEEFDISRLLLIRENGDRKSVLKTTAGYIIITEFCERLAYFGFAGSLVLFFQTHMGLTNAEADIQYAAWTGACYLTPLLGGYVADTYLGRYNTIYAFCVIYLGGLVLVLIGCLPGDAEPLIIYPAIYIIALGTGGIKPNVCTLGADQFNDGYERDRREKESFFHWFYWSVNLASVFAYSIVAYICQNGIPYFGGERWGFFAGFLIPCTAMALGILIFVGGSDRYVKFPPKGSVLSDAIGIIVEAVWTRRSRTGPGSSGGSEKKGVYEHLTGEESGDEQMLKEEELGGSSSSQVGGEHVLDRACVAHGGSYGQSTVEGVKLVMRLVPIMSTLIVFWGLYAQIYTAFQNQGCQMDLSMGKGVQFTVPISALGMFEAIAILIFAPMVDLTIYPWLKSLGFSVSLLWRMGCGFVFSILSMLLAAMVEYYRVRAAPEPNNYYDVSARDNITPCQNIDDYNPYNYQNWLAGIDDTDKPTHCHQVCEEYYTVDSVTYLNMTCIDCDNIPQMSDVSIFWQIPQFMVTGISLVLTGITALEFFYSQAPLPMRSVCQSFNLFTTALGTWLTIPLVYAVNSDSNHEWLPVNLDDGELVNYFLLLAGIMVLNVVYFYYVTRDYVYKSADELQHLNDLYDKENAAAAGVSGGSSSAGAELGAEIGAATVRSAHKGASPLINSGSDEGGRDNRRDTIVERDSEAYEFITGRDSDVSENTIPSGNRLSNIFMNSAAAGVAQAGEEVKNPISS